jgi:hypothetical protein
LLHITTRLNCFFLQTKFILALSNKIYSYVIKRAYLYTGRYAGDSIGIKPDRHAPNISALQEYHYCDYCHTGYYLVVEVGRYSCCLKKRQTIRKSSA